MPEPDWTWLRCELAVDSQAASQWQLKFRCAPRLKPGSFCVAIRVFWGHRLLNFESWWAWTVWIGISTAFRSNSTVWKTTKHAHLYPLVRVRTHRFCFKRQLFLYFVNKIYLPCYCVVSPLLRPIWSNAISASHRCLGFHWNKGKAAVPAARSESIHWKITLPIQFLRRIKKEMLKFHVNSKSVH